MVGVGKKKEHRDGNPVLLACLKKSERESDYYQTIVYSN